MLAAALVSVFALVTSQDVDAGLVGLMMSYSVSVTGSLNWVVRSASEVETNIVSGESSCWVSRFIASLTILPLSLQSSESSDLPSWPLRLLMTFPKPSLLLHGLNT